MEISSHKLHKCPSKLMAGRKAIIDLGSNTFHLLIVDLNDDNSFTQVYKERKFVGLATGGIEMIDKDRIEKALSAIEEFKDTIESYNVQSTIATGTAALRSARNGQFLATKIEELYKIPVEIIGGEREAELIYKGVQWITDMSDGNHVIMDIGGGSVEFILVVNGALTWAKSYNIGVGVLHNLYHRTDPISKTDTTSLKAFVKSSIQDFFERIKGMSIDSLIGASGSFEVIESMNGLSLTKDKIREVTIDDYHNVSSKLIGSTTSEREKMEGLPSSRVKLIVVAMILIDEVLAYIQPNKILISPYALKEGIISEL